MEIIENTYIKNVSYLRARDPSIIACSYHLSGVKANLDDELARQDSSFGVAEYTKEDFGNLQVYLRIKNCDNFGKLYEVVNNNTLVCKVPEGAYCTRNLRDGSVVTKKYTFSKIFEPLSTQDEIFNGVVKSKVLHFINGYNCSLLTYGTSGSGKTFTIVGTADSPGIIPRALEYLFRTLPKLVEQPRIKPTAAGGILNLNEADCKTETNTRQNLLKTFNTSFDRAQHTQTYRRMQERLSREPVAEVTADVSDISLGVWVSFAEIYNEYVYDLLKPAPPRGQQKQKLRLGCSNGSAYIKDLTCISVSSGLEAYQILQYGLHNLRYAATLVNDHSSRSHSVFTIKLVQASKKENGVSISLFNFCDLAGSERLKHTHNMGERLKESNNINTSLLVLGRCISLIRESQRNKDNRLIPFRESKLTQLFQKALSGQEAIAMIVNVNPTGNMFDESQHVLNFSAIAKDVIVEQEQIIQRPLSNRFSEYMDRRNADFIDANNQSGILDVEEMQQQLVLLCNELQQTKLDAEEEREHVITTYKKILAETQKYWEDRCQRQHELLVKTMRESRERSEHLTKKKLSIVNVDSSSDEECIDLTNGSDSEECAAGKCDAATQLVLMKTDFAYAKSQLEEKNTEIQKLISENKTLDETLKDAEKAYLALQAQYKIECKNLRSKILEQQDQITELNIYIDDLHRTDVEETDCFEEKENSKPLVCNNNIFTKDLCIKPPEKINSNVDKENSNPLVCNGNTSINLCTKPGEEIDFFKITEDLKQLFENIPNDSDINKSQSFRF